MIDKDDSLNLEKPNVAHFFMDSILVPILNNLPTSFDKLIKKTNDQAEKVIENVTNHAALEILYKKGVSKKRGFFNSLSRKIWFNIGNSKAVRNRLKFVMREIDNHLKNISTKDKEINILNIASGSARAVIETVEKQNYLEGSKVSITFLDKNPQALDYSKNLSENIKHLNLTWINDTVGGFFEKNQDLKNKFDIVEIVGLFDYFDDEKVLKTMKGIYDLLAEGGIVITANINHNREEKFVTRVIKWPMIYRNIEEMSVLASKAGFSKDNIRAFYEPFKIHGLLVCKK